MKKMRLGIHVFLLATFLVVITAGLSFGEQFNGLYYYPSHRVLTRLGLTYAVDSATRPYYIVPDGLVNIFGEFIG